MKEYVRENIDKNMKLAEEDFKEGKSIKLDKSAFEDVKVISTGINFAKLEKVKK